MGYKIMGAKKMKVNDILDLFDHSVYFEVYTIDDCMAIGTAEQLRDNTFWFLYSDREVAKIRPVNKQFVYIIIE